MRTLSHFGIPTAVKPAEAAYIEPLKVYVTDYGKSANKLEFLYFEPDSPMHELMKTRAHVAYDVPCLKCELEGAKVLLEPLDCGDMTIAFDETTQCYSIPVTGDVGYYRAKVTALFKQEGRLHVTVGYIPLGGTGDLIGTQSDTPTKYMDYLFERTGGSWYLTGLTESATKPEQAASSQANSVVMMDPDELQEAILQGVDPNAASSGADSGAASSEAASSEEAAGDQETEEAGSAASDQAA